MLRFCIDDRDGGGANRPPGQRNRIERRHGIGALLLQWRIRALDKMPEPHLYARSLSDGVEESALAGNRGWDGSHLPSSRYRRRNLSSLSVCTEILTPPKAGPGCAGVPARTSPRGAMSTGKRERTRCLLVPTVPITAEFRYRL